MQHKGRESSAELRVRWLIFPANQLLVELETICMRRATLFFGWREFFQQYLAMKTYLSVQVLFLSAAEIPWF